MYEQTDKTKENKSRAVTNSVSQKKSIVKHGIGFVDNRPATLRHQYLQRMIDESTINDHVIQQTKAGAGVGSVVGGAIGAMGFLAGPVVGSITTAVGMGLGGLMGEYLTGSGDAEPVEISIAENEVKTAEVADTIKYPSVTSCMTITLVLANGKKVGGHIGLYAGSAGGVIGRMNAARGGIAISTILAKGHGSIWGSHLQNTEELRPMISDEFLRRHPNGDFESIGYEEFGEIQGVLSIQQNQGVFTNWIAGQFGGGAVVYQNTGDGDLYIAADGTFA